MIVVAIFLWLVSIALGGVVVIQTYEASRIVAALIIPDNPLQTVMSRKQPILVSRVVLIVMMIVWVAAVVWLLVRYYQLADEGRRLWSAFAKTTAIELILLCLTWAVVNYLPYLVWGGVP